jgi:hypothetical protein
MTAPISQQVFDKLSELSSSLELHIATDKPNADKIAAMYKILVTGNGTPSLPETVRTHEAWMVTRKGEIAEDEKNKAAFHRQLILLFVGQALTFTLLGIAVYIGWR